MSTAPRTHLMTVDDFVATADERAGKWELEDGVLVSMSPERLGHWRTVSAATNALSAAIGKDKRCCEAVGDSIGVRVSERTSYQPDVSVYCGPRRTDDTFYVNDPVIVVEVLSRSTAHRDQSTKLAGYFSLPSVHHSLILSPEARMVVHHKRGQGDLIETRILREGPLRLDPPGIEVEAGALFAEA